LFDSFIYSLSAVAPIIFMIVLGNLLSRKMLSQSFFDVCDTLVYKLALPVFVFCKLASADLSDLPDSSLIFYCIAIILSAFIIISIFAHFLLPREKLEINPAEPRYIKVVWGQGYKIERGTK